MTDARELLADFAAEADVIGVPRLTPAQETFVLWCCQTPLAAHLRKDAEVFRIIVAEALGISDGSPTRLAQPDPLLTEAASLHGRVC